MTTKELIAAFEAGTFKAKIEDIYVDPARIDSETARYIEAIKQFENLFGDGECEIFSAPGRSEVAGNHTDHQHGEVLATSINNDAIAIVRPTSDNKITLKSDDYDVITVDLSDLGMKEDEQVSTTALIKGVAAGVKNRGYRIGGFCAYVTSEVLIGAGLSSSAAFETVVGTVLSGLYNDMKISATEIAIIGQYAENVYFGKPCGLMDQMACSVGSLVHIDFADPENPITEKVEFDMDKAGYSLCITDTKGSHADLTADYAAVPAEMKAAAHVFGKEYLHDVPESDILAGIPKIREEAGDRAALRALHFIEENKRVQKDVAALKAGDIDAFLAGIKASGDSSFKYLQNVYTSADVQHQNVSVALAVSDIVLGDAGVARVHGGGFAGTIQAFVKNAKVAEYKDAMDNIFGEGACSVLKIRKYGGMKVI